jgi:hypothetical protein
MPTINALLSLVVKTLRATSAMVAGERKNQRKIFFAGSLSEKKTSHTLKTDTLLRQVTMPRTRQSRLGRQHLIHKSILLPLSRRSSGDLLSTLGVPKLRSLTEPMECAIRKFAGTLVPVSRKEE